MPETAFTDKADQPIDEALTLDDKGWSQRAVEAQTETSSARREPPVTSRFNHEAWYLAIPLPLSKFLDARVFLCSLFIAVPFGWTVGITILSRCEVISTLFATDHKIADPQVFEKAPWQFDAVHIGLVYLGALAGTLVGKLLGGYVVDASLILWRDHWAKEGVDEAYAEQRLWSLLVFLPMGIAGWLCYGYGIGERMHWP